jgi:dihydrofolate synthase / folylpolyglutamate synthase
VEAARLDVPLTYFEFGTLAALLLFREAGPDAVVLEVGLGGRLDAVNLVDADVAIVSSIGIDHTDWLGPDRESIGREKAGIFRPGKPAVCGDPQLPESLRQYAASLGTELHCLGESYRIMRQPGQDSWAWTGMDTVINDLPRPALKGEIQLQNAAAVITALKLLGTHLPVSETAIRQGLQQASLPGRFQQIGGAIPVILDVAHNAEAASALAATLAEETCQGRTLAVLGMLRDKPASTVGAIMDAQVHAWYLGGLNVSGRGQDAKTLETALGKRQAPVFCHADIPTAYAAARQAARPGDRLVVFGSFHTVESVLRIAE